MTLERWWSHAQTGRMLQPSSQQQQPLLQDKEQVVEVIYSSTDYQEKYSKWPHKIALVPTMGALHKGHLSLVSLAFQHCSLVVVTIFVNPTQFGPNEDYNIYPKTLDSDLHLLTELVRTYNDKKLVILVPSVQDMYPFGLAESVMVRIEAKMIKVLEGKARPRHFDGVLTVITKLLNMVAPALLILGQKDVQQCLVVKRMMKDLGYSPRITLLVGPTQREEDGLACSSRNRFLFPEERQLVGIIWNALQQAEACFNQGAGVSEIITSIKTLLETKSELLSIEYVSLARMEDLEECREEEFRGGILSLTVKTGKSGIRLLDNIILGCSI